MANAVITVLEADGVTQTDVKVLDVGRQGEAASKSIATCTEDKAVLDALAAVLGTTAGAKVITDAAGTIQQYLRGLVSLVPALGQAAMASGTPVTLANNQTFGGRQTSANSLSAALPSDSEITITHTPSCFAGALAAGDVVFATEEIANVVLSNGAQFELASIQVSDISDLGAALDLYFFNANTALGTEDSAPDIDDTEVLTVIKGPVSILASDWKDLGANRVASIDNLGLKMKAGAATTSIWWGGVTQTAATFAAGTLQFQLTFVRK